MNKRKRIAGIFVLGMLALAFCLPIRAQAAGLNLDNVDLSRKDGSITVTMQDEGEPVLGGDLYLYKVANVISGSKGYEFAYTEHFKGNGKYTIERLTEDDGKLQIKDAAVKAEDLASYVKTRGLSADQKVDEITDDGVVIFKGLDTGLYLLVQKKAGEDYEKISPFLITVPNEDKYEVSATPKFELTVVPPQEGTTKPESTTTTKKSTRTSTSSKSKKTGRLPQTGQLWWPVGLMAGLGVLFIVVGLMRRKRS